MNRIRAYLPFEASLLAAVLLLSGASSFAQVSASGTSESVTLNCTGSPCPWGSPISGRAIVWPAAVAPSTARLGYTATKGVYLSASYANGAMIWIDSGNASIYAGLPSVTSHRLLTSLSAGGSYLVSGLQPGEVLSVQGSSNFSYQIDLPPPSGPEVPPDPTTTSQFVTWNCTGSPCPWGSPLSGQAIVWPAAKDPGNTRLGYTTSQAVYLPANYANGTIIWVDAGSATVYAGLPGSSSHSVLATINAGQNYVVSGLSAGQMLSVQGASAFQFQIDVPETPQPEIPPAGTASEPVTLTCTGLNCPWGSPLSGHAIAWPASAQPTTSRLGYTASKRVYLPANVANGSTISIESGNVAIYAGAPGASSHRLLASVSSGTWYVVSGLQTGEVLSVQSAASFTYELELTDPPPPDGEVDIIQAIPAFWRCDIPECSGSDWAGSVIDWPSWAAYSSNARSGDQSRTVYSSAGGLLYPYMGSWASGCEVTARSGTVVIIEWERGTDVWRETWLNPSESHVINLTSPEDGAMIEGFSFSVSLENCTPQPLP